MSRRILAPRHARQRRRHSEARHVQVEALEPRRLLAVTINEFPIPTASSSPLEITTGPDGNLWFTETSGENIGRINPTTHAIAEFPIPTVNGGPDAITAGPDGNLWFTEDLGNKIGRINPTTHAIAEFPIPTAGSSPKGITAGPDGNLWFTEYLGNQIGQINPTTHAIAEFPIPTAGGSPVGITAGPDGNLWFTERNRDKIGRINPSTHAITEFTVPTAGSEPFGITAGPDGNLWFTEIDVIVGKIGRINPTTHAITEFTVPTANSVPWGITTGPDGNLWFTESNGNKIGRINPTTHAITESPTIPTANSRPGGITAGPDGNLWFLEGNGNKISQVQITTAQIPTTTQLASTPNPSFFGQSVTFTATVTKAPGSAGTPAGSVAFQEGTTTLKTVPLDASGHARFTTDTLPVGSHSIIAVYAGNSTFASSPSKAVVEVVNVRPTGTMLTSSRDPSTVGQPVTFTATVEARTLAAGLAIRDTVTFRVDGVPERSVPIHVTNGLGRATFTTSSLTAGVHHVVADYSGGSEYGPSPSNTVTQVVNRAAAAATHTTLKSSPNPSTAGQPVTFTATVTSAAGTPVGSVTFREGQTTLQVVALDANGQARFTTATLGVGQQAITADYGGNAAFAASSGGTTQTINAPVTGQAPRVVGLQRFGFHLQPTILVLTFDRPLDPASAQDAGNYVITGPGGHRIGLLSVAYDPVAQTVTLFPSRRLNVHFAYHLTVIGTGSGGVRGADGKLLDGTGTGQAGSDYQAVIDRSTLVLTPSPTRPAVHPHGPRFRRTDD